MTLTSIAFLLAFVSACVMALARHPIFGLFAYVIIYYVNPPVRWWGQGILLDFRWSFIAATVTVIAILAHKTGRQGMRFRDQPIVRGFAFFLVWLALQLFWAVDRDLQLELLEFYSKFLIALFMIYRAVDSERHFRWFIWAHVLGCFYFGWLVYTGYEGGRFEDFGGAGIKDANEAALTIGTSVLLAGSLIVYENLRNKVILAGTLPFLVNAIVATVSRSGFLALALGGAVFNVLTPARLRKWVVPLTVLAVVLLVSLTNQVYWSRISTIAYKGEQVEGIDTGANRIGVIKAQLVMARDYPFGCGYFCTTILSPRYMDPSLLTPGVGLRSSHNVFFSLLVENGLPGAIMYLVFIAWTVRRIWQLSVSSRDRSRFVSIFLPGVAGSFAAMFLADMFVPYVKFEVRIWFVGLLLVLSRLQAIHDAEHVARAECAQGPGLGGGQPVSVV